MSLTHIRYIAWCSGLGLLVLLFIPCRSAATEPWFAEPVVSSSPRPLQYPAVGDLNHDGIGDLVGEATNASRGYIFLGNALGQMALVDSFPMNTGVHAPVIIDENADSHPDIIWGDGSSFAHVERNDGTGHFESVGYHGGCDRPHAVSTIKKVDGM